MSRRHRAAKRDILPDPKFGDVVVTRFMNALMYDGKKSAAETIVADEVARFTEDQRGRGAAPMVVALRERLEGIRSAELERRISELGELTDAQREAVEALTRSILAKVVHEPTVALKDSAGTPRGERLVEAARILFGL